MRSLILGCAICLGGCDEPPAASADGPVADAPPAPGTLGNGGNTSGAGGVTLFALSDTLAAPVSIAIDSAAVPAEALPTEATRRGDFFALRAGADTLASAARPFFVAVPVPQGADGAHLALAALVPADTALDADLAGRAWIFLDGTYVGAAGALYVPLGFVAAEGRTFVLVEHPDADSTPAPASAARRRADQVPPIGSGPLDADVPQVGFDFFVTCRGLLPEECPQSFKDDMAALFSFVRSELVGMGFREPRTPKKVVPNFVGQLQAVGYVVYVTRFGSELCKSGLVDGVGIYHPENGAIYVCLRDPSAGITQEVANAVVHEYFHATQYAYATPSSFSAFFRSAYQAWLFEGTAAAAERSYLNNSATTGHTMSRSDDYPWHEVDVGLRSADKDYEYRSQDFWVYAGEKVHKDMDYLIPIFEAGATLDAIQNELYAFDLEEMHWLWVKNQLMEKAVDFEGELTTPCFFDNVRMLANDYPDWHWFPVHTPAPFVGTIGPLQATAVRILPIDGLPSRIRVEEGSGSSDIRFKIYEELGACGDSITDGARDFDADASKSYFIVIANGSAIVPRVFELIGTEVK